MAYSPEEIERIFEEVCSDIENGMALRGALKKEGRPSSKTFYEWIESDENRIKRYARACERRADEIFEDIMDIADDKSGDILKGEDGQEYLNQEFVQRARVKIDARKWMLGKMQPKKYGDRTVNENHNVNHNIELSKDEFKELSNELDNEY